MLGSAERGRRRRPGGLAAPEPGRRRRDREPRRLADDRASSRVCLNVLQARRSRPEVPLDPTSPEPAAERPADPEQEALLADSIGLALLVVLDTLSPAERVAFVLHDMFGVPFEEIAPIVGRTRRPPASSPAARAAACGAQDATPDADRVRQRRARRRVPRRRPRRRLRRACSPSSTPTSCSRADPAAARSARRRRLHGAAEVGRVRAATRAAPRRRCSTAPPRSSGWWAASRASSTASRRAATRITAIELIADPGRLRELDLVITR